MSLEANISLLTVSVLTNIVCCVCCVLVEAFSVASSYPQTPRAISGLSRPDHAKEKGNLLHVAFKLVTRVTSLAAAAAAALV